MQLSSDILINLILLVGNFLPLEGKKHHASRRAYNESSESPRVLGGSTTNIEDYPFMVSIQSFYSNWFHNCGGSIISRWAVLTACHCLVSSYIGGVVYRHPYYYRVLAGVSDLRYAAYGQAIRAHRFVVHPQCGGPQLYMDAGVIQLKSPFFFNQAVQPIRFSTLNRQQAKRQLREMERTGTQCFSPGWGTTVPLQAGYRPSWRLKVLPTNLLSSQGCANVFCRLGGWNCGTDFYRANQVCALSPSGIVCNGDSGGPLVCNGFVIGVVSWKWQCYANWPHVYSDIAPILDVASWFIRGGG